MYLDIFQSEKQQDIKKLNILYSIYVFRNVNNQGRICTCVHYNVHFTTF